MHMLRKIPKWIIAAVLYSIILLYLFYPTLTLHQDKILFGYDLRDYFYYTRYFLQSSIKHFHIPWWNPYTFSGMPYLEHPQNGSIFYPFIWVFMLFPYHQSYTWFYLIHIFIAMIGMYILSGELYKKGNLSKTFIPSWISGLVFGLSGYFITYVAGGQVDIISAISWIPVTYFFFWRLIHAGTFPEQRRYIGFSALFFALQIFAGYQAISLFMLLLLGMTVVYFTVIKHAYKPILFVILAGILAYLVCFIDILPKFIYLSQSMRSSALTYDLSYPKELTFNGLINIIKPKNNTHEQFTFFKYMLGNGYIGLTASLLAVLSLLSAVKWKKIRLDILLFLGMAIITLWISLGSNAPFDLYYVIWKYFPLYHNFRYAEKHLILVIFSLSILSGYGVMVVRHQIIRSLITIFLVIELSLFAKQYITVGDLPDAKTDPQLISLFSSSQDIYRIYPAFDLGCPPHAAFDFNTPLMHHAFSVRGYESALLRNYYEFIYVAGGFGNIGQISTFESIPIFNVSLPLINFLNIKYIIIPPWFDYIAQNKYEQFKVVAENQDQGYRIYENTHMLPRFYLVGDAKTAQTREEESQLIKSIDFTHQVVLPESPESTKFISELDCQTSQNKGNVHIDKYSEEKITITTDSSCNTFLVSSEVMYPGWRATVDGKSTPVMEGNLAFRTIYLPRGKHLVVYEYRSDYFIIGGVVSLIALLGCIGLITKKFGFSIQKMADSK